MTMNEPPTFESNDEYTQLLSELHNAYCQSMPYDVLQFCANFFNQKLAEQRAAFRQQPLESYASALAEEHHPLSAGINTMQDSYSMFAPGSKLQDDSEGDEEEDDDQEEFDYADEGRDTLLNDPVTLAPLYNRGRRTSVSAESIVPSKDHDFQKIIIPKSAEQAERIRASVANNFLFRNLDEEQYQDVVNAMSEKRIASGVSVIEQGDVGDFFYVVESGTLDCFIAKDGENIKVASYEAGGSFGELALMYNAPRAATIVTTSPSVLWALDRVTFRTILMEDTSRRRSLYESFLQDVPLLKSLEPYERHKIADALESVYFEDGQQVVTQGDVGDQFYLIELGEALVYKTGEDGTSVQVNTLRRGMYFGELALLNDSPRAATVVAKGRLKCAMLGKKAFTRLLGPVLDILKRNSENIANYYALVGEHSATEHQHPTAPM